MRKKYNLIDNANNNTLRWLNVKSTNELEEVTRKTGDVIEKDESEMIQRELASVRAVLEMREEELRKLRWKLDWSQVMCDVKHIQTQTEDGLADVNKPLTHLVTESRVDGRDIVDQNLCDKSDLGQRGWSVTFYYNLILNSVQCILVLMGLSWTKKTRKRLGQRLLCQQIM